MNILYVNSCVRENSRTNILAKYFLEKYNQDYNEICLEKEKFSPLTNESLTKRDIFLQNNDYSDKMFDYAKQFANADKIVISAPYWDLSFPASLKAYLEMINVSGLTFKYSELGVPTGLCKAVELIYITTAGGQMVDDYGFNYIKALCNGLYGINKVTCFKAEGLDLFGADTDGILNNTKSEIDKYFLM